MEIELDFTEGRRDLVATSGAGDVHRFALYQTLTREHAESMAADARLPRLLQPLEESRTSATLAAIATSLQLLQEAVLQRQLGIVPVFADDEYTQMLAHERIFAAAVEALGSEVAARAWMVKPAIGLDGRRPIDLLATTEGAQVVEDFLCRLRSGVYT